jgi:hypothetical protein
MSLLAIVTFDLHGATRPDYDRLTQRLSEIGLEPKIKKSKGSKSIKLTNNTYAGKFKRKAETAIELRDDLRKKTVRAMKDSDLSGEILVIVGTGWAWGKRKVQQIAA